MSLVLNPVLPPSAALAAIQGFAPHGAHLRQDSRAVCAGDVFVAHSGAAHDGRAFILAAFAAGASCVLADASDFSSSDARVVLVHDLKANLGSIASDFYGAPSAALNCVAFTGTNGKTTCSGWAALLAQCVSNTPSAIVGTLGAGLLGQEKTTGLTTPQASDLQCILAESASLGAGAAFVEASSIGWSEGRLNGLVFCVAAFTNLTQDHLDYHGSMGAYAAVKRELFDGASLHTAVLNVDDATGAAWAAQLAVQRPKLRMIRTGFGAAAELRASGLVVSSDGTQQFTLHFGDQTHAVTLNALGAFNVQNCLTAVASVMALGYDLAQIVPHLGKLRGAAGRVETITLPAQPLVVVDYAHTPDGLAQALQALRPIAVQRGGNLTVIFGCGGDRDAAKRPLMGAVAAQFADAVVISNDNPRSEAPAAIAAHIASTAPQASVELDRAAAIASAIAAAKAQDVVLIAGKGHETTQTTGKRTVHFSDLEQAQAALNARASQTMTFETVLQWLPNATLKLPPSGQFATHCLGVNTDTRSLKVGQLFVALNGDTHDGHDFLALAATKHATGALVNANAPQAQLECAIPLILVPNTGAALQLLAQQFRLQFSLPLAVIVGSNGKTTVKEMIATIFQTHCLLTTEAGAPPQAAHSTQGNFNNAIGLPLTLLKLSSAHAFSAVELGMNHPGETAELARLAAPTIAVINNAQREHQEFMLTVDAVAQEHAHVLDALPAHGVAVLPAQDAYFARWQARAAGRNIIDFALHSGADRTPAAVTGMTQAQGLNQQLTLQTPQGEALITLRTTGEHNARNALAATAAALAAGVPLASIVAGLQAFNPVKGRMQQHALQGSNGAFTAIDDSYNANPDSVAAAIAVLDAQSAHGRCVLVLGDMGEVGTQGEAFHREAGVLAAASGIAAFYTLGNLCAYAHSAFSQAAPHKPAQHFANMQALSSHLQATALQAGDTVLIKGSRFMQMERVLHALLNGTRSGTPPLHVGAH